MSAQTAVVDQDVQDVDLPEGLAEQLIEAARTQGVQLTGPGGLLSGLTRQVLQAALETEMTEHLGHASGGVPGPGGTCVTGIAPRPCVPRSAT
jgi:hypothetical protein